MEVKTLRKIATQVSHFSDQIKKAVPKFENLDPNLEITKEVSIYSDFPKTSNKLKGVTMEYSSSGNGRFRKLKPNGELIEEDNIIEGVLKNLNNGLQPKYIDHLNIYSKSDNKPIAILEKIDNIWVTIYQRP